MQNPYDLTPEVNILYQSVELPFISLLRRGGFTKSDLREFIPAWQKVYSDVLDAQVKDKRRFHKGGLLHNLGILYLLLGEPEYAYKNFVYGYSEDVASEYQGFLDSALNSPGAKTLIINWGVAPDFLKLVKERVIEKVKESGFLDPQAELQDFFETNVRALEQVIELETDKRRSFEVGRNKNLEKIPGDWDRRLFIGGSYTDAAIISKIRLIESIVKKNNFTPIIVSDFQNIPGMSDFVKSIRLLTSCKYAIFEATEASGHLLELSLADQCRIKTLVLCDSTSTNKSISSLLKHIHTETKYSGIQDLTEKVEAFLAECK